MALPKQKNNQQEFYDRTGDHAAGADIVAMPVNETPQADRQSQAQTPRLRIGELLKRERERRGYDLQQIADYLCIRRSLLAALENSRYEEFPADAYVIGFLRSYAELIGIKGQDAIDHYRQEMAGRRKKPDLVLPTPISEGRAPTAVIMGAAALVSLMIYILWYAFSTSDRTAITTPPALPTVAEAPIAAPQIQPTALPGNATETLPTAAPSGIALSSSPQTAKTLDPATAAAVPAAPKSPYIGHIMIKADQSSWILIANDKGETVYDHVMKPGDVYQVPDAPGLTLTTGNGAGIVVMLDGADLPRLSNVPSHIVRNVPLETSALKALPKNPVQ